jgi:hypothetical protein
MVRDEMVKDGLNDLGRKSRGFSENGFLVI